MFKSTPYYSFDLKKLATNMEVLKNAIQADRFFYALKPNSEKKILVELDKLNCNFEVASVGEYQNLEQIGVSSDRIICSLPIKSETMLSQLASSGVSYFVFDNLTEFQKILSYAPQSLKIARIYINDIAPNTIEFGIHESELISWLDNGIISPTDIAGVTFYVSKNTNIDILLCVLERMSSLLKRLPNGRIVNIGGNYRLPSEIDNIFYPALRAKMQYMRYLYSCLFFVEPGRSVVKSAGKLFTHIIAIKQNKTVPYVYIDAGIPTGISYCPPSFSVIDKKNINQSIEYNFFDITCSHRLLFCAELNYELSVGDIIVFEHYGSYSIAKSSNFHGWTYPSVYYD